MSSTDEVEQENINSKRKEISPLDSSKLLGKTRSRTKDLKKKIRTEDPRAVVCPSDTDSESVLVGRPDTRYIMTDNMHTSSPVGVQVTTTTSAPSMSAQPHSLIQSLNQYEFPTDPRRFDQEEAISRAVRAAEINMQMKHHEELDALRAEIQKLKLTVNNRSVVPPDQSSSTYTGAISKNRNSRNGPNDPMYHDPSVQTSSIHNNQLHSRTHLVGSLPQTVFSSIPPNPSTNIFSAPIQNHMHPYQTPIFPYGPPQINPPNMSQPPPPPYMNQNIRPNLNPSFNESVGSSHQKSVPIHKWKIRFNGDGSVNNFLFQVHTLRRKNFYDEEDVFNNFDLLLEGRAESFYWRFIRMNPGARYTAFVRAFSVEFGSTEKDCMIMANLAQKRQGLNESFTTYLEVMRTLLDKMEFPIPDNSFISLVKSNCKPELSNLLFAVPIHSKEALSRAGKDAEQQLGYQNKLFKPYSNRFDNYKRTVSEIEINDELGKIEELEAQINALKVQAQRKYSQPNTSESKYENNIRGCFNCYDLNHFQKDCPKEVTEVYCYRCGTRGVITPKCQKCRTKNL